MWKQIVILILIAIVVNSREFRNPVLESDNFARPTIINKDGLYYMITHTFDETEEASQQNWFAIHTSRDLQDWTKIGYVFDKNTFPSFAATPYGYGVHSPSLYYDYNTQKFIVTFTAPVGSERLYAMGIATSSSIFGPFVEAPNMPFSLRSRAMEDFYPTLINDKEDWYLVYSGEFGITGRRLNMTDMILTGEAILLIRPTEQWEYSRVIAPKYVKRNNTHYIFYSSGAGCMGTNYKESAIGVAKSSSPLGPYEKLVQPLLSTNLSQTWGTSHGSLVQDSVSRTDVLFYSGVSIDIADNCTPTEFRVIPVKWNNKDWPYFE